MPNARKVSQPCWDSIDASILVGVNKLCVVSAALFLVASSSGALRAQSPTIAFASDRTGRNQIWTVVPANAPVGPLTTAGGGSQESNEPMWSPSSGLIAYQFGASGVRGFTL